MQIFFVDHDFAVGFFFEAARFVKFRKKMKDIDYRANNNN